MYRCFIHINFYQSTQQFEKSDVLVNGKNRIYIFLTRLDDIRYHTYIEYNKVRSTLLNVYVTIFFFIMLAVYEGHILSI